MVSKNEINDDFNKAMDITKNILNNIGISIDIEEYDGIIVKKLSSSNTLDSNRTTNQTHIAITGNQMNIFPYLQSDGYFADDSADDTLKKFFILKAPIVLDKRNISYLKKEELKETEDPKLESYTTIVRNKRSNQADQIQLSLKKHDDEEFILFRELLHEDYYLIMLKLKEEFKYEVYGVCPNDAPDSFNKLNNTFHHSVTETLFSTDNINKSSSDRSIDGQNILLYGVPGSGKSWTIQNDYCNDETHMERVVFHPDYTYSDFIGQILPKVENGNVSYEFVPGPFTLILKKAEDNPKEKFFLII